MTENQFSTLFLIVAVTVGVILTVWVLYDRHAYEQHCHAAGGSVVDVSTKQRLCVSTDGRILPV